MTENSQHTTLHGSQGAAHPILQQIDTLNKLYNPAGPVIVVDTDAQGQSDTVDDIGNLAQDSVNESISTEVFSAYRHREILPGCRAHPGDIVEAGPLAGITPPDTYYPLSVSLPKEIISECKLSSLQLEGVIHACQRHQMILSNGQRAGFFIGDAAGVGKGRQIAGIILDNYARGRTKSIWFTISSDLIVDSKRDLGDLGCYVKVIDGCQELDKHTSADPDEMPPNVAFHLGDSLQKMSVLYAAMKRVLGLPADFKSGVVFSTYATLVSTVQKGGSVTGSRQTRLQQLVNWCGGKEFDGCLIFDECHKAKNFVPGKEQASTKVAVAVTSIQRMLPKARVLYCSATGVSDVKNMAFMERLGLWGEGAPYRNFEQFLVSVQKKGLGMAEILAMEMKSAGMYVSRGLSYKQAEFVTVEAPLTNEQRKMYDTAAHVWNELRKALESASVRTTQNNGRIWQQFWSCHQRFFKQLCLGMKVPTIVKEAQHALDNGQCIVIGLQTTGEASLDSELGKTKGSLKGFVSLCREILSRFIEQSFPTRIDPGKEGEIREDPWRMTAKNMLLEFAKKEGEIREDPWSVTAKNMLLEFAKKIPLPDSPLDEIIDKLGGPKCVAEMTGRKGRVVRHSPTDTPQYEGRTPDSDAYGAIDSLNVYERNQFMEGKKLVAIISDAASTGISLHSDLRVANQRRRVHLTVELPWSADKAVQQLGRSHRSNQSSGPLYKLLTTDLGGERRFAAAVARRLQSLGALTKGDRRAATGADLTEFNFDTQYGRLALRTMYHHISKKTLVPGLSLSKLTDDNYDFDTFNQQMQESLVLMGLVDIDMLRSGPVLKEKDTGDVSKFLNRILGLTVEKQNMMFSYFTECMKLMIQNAKNEGRYNEGMLDITASSVEMVGKPREIFKNHNKGHTSTRLVELNIDRGMSWEMAVTRADNHQERHDGFYVSKREIFGKKLYILATQKENSTHLVKIARPNTGLSTLDEEKTDVLHRYSPVNRETAEKGWKELYEETKTNCIHGSHCKNKDFCKVGCRCYRLHLLCGSIVSMMNMLEVTLRNSAGKLNLSKSESNIRVVRVQLNDGERIVGIRYPEILIQEVERAMKEQKMLEKAQKSLLAQAQLQLSQSAMLNSSLATSHMTNLSQSTSQMVNLSQSSQNTSLVYPNMSSSQLSTTGQQNIQASTSASIDLVPKSDNSSSTDNSAEPVSATVIEEVTPVNSSALAKALRPPVTIKNFFKPSKQNTDSPTISDKFTSKYEKEISTKVKSSESSEKSDCDTSERRLTRKNSEDSASRITKKEISYSEFLELQNDTSENDKIVKDLSSETDDGSVKTESDKNVKDLRNETDNRCVKTEKQDERNGSDIVVLDENSNESSSGSSHLSESSSHVRTIPKKRRLDNQSCDQPAKKKKQVTLKSTFAKMESKSVTCPICAKVFEKGVSNEALNQHIDNCIIE